MVLTFIAHLFGRRDVIFHPNRVRKLMISTNVIGEKLEHDGYRLKYSLEEGLRDWLVDTK